ncbi:MAG: hypothetical protein IPP17_08650 [Bacteroidetes bacterium]|nr:hypothetical protein [Bacteroidota bacterium]
MQWLDANGVAEVQLPSYFQAVNVDFSYQLTPVGSAAAVFVAEEINAQGRFKIAGGGPGQKVCWTVYADRNDPLCSKTGKYFRRTCQTGCRCGPVFATRIVWTTQGKGNL